MKKRHDLTDEFPEIAVRKAIQQGVSQAEAAFNQKKTRRSHRIIFTFISLAATVFFIFASAYFSPSIASELSRLPIIGSVFEQSGEKDIQLAKKHGLTNQVGEKKTVDGISVTVDEVLYDQNNISIGLFIESEKPLPSYYFGAGMDITIDGKNPSYLTSNYEEEKISDHERMGIQQIMITDEMPDAFELGLILYGEKGERWDFSLPVEKIENVKKLLINHSQKLGNLEISVDEILISQTGLTLTYESVEVETAFEESLGGHVEFTIVDQNGREIPGVTGGVVGEVIDGKIYHSSNKQFEAIDDSVTSLTITPYFDEWIESGVEVDGDKKVKQFERSSDSERGSFESFNVNLR